MKLYIDHHFLKFLNETLNMFSFAGGHGWVETSHFTDSDADDRDSEVDKTIEIREEICHKHQSTAPLSPGNVN